MTNELVKNNIDNEQKTDNKPFYVPRVNVQYDDKETTIFAEMPGVDDKNVELSLEENTLTINGYCRLQVPEGYQLKWQEYKIGHYRKSFTLNDRLDTTKITAVMKDGILKIVLPVKEKCQPVKIKVSGE